MTLKSLGEFGLIDKIKKWTRVDASVIRGIGDDCAVVRNGRDQYQLLTCDGIVEGVDFKRTDDPFLVGRKAIAVNISDIAAKGGTPRHALVFLGLPKTTSLKYVERLYAGINYWAKIYKINIVGGDISAASKITIVITMAGVVGKKQLVLRDGAREKDVVMVSGKIGGSIRGKHLSFTPRLAEARYLADNYTVTSMIDISDGLLQDLGHILKASNRGAVIYDDLIPQSKDCRSLAEALTMGEDFELLFTMPINEAMRLRAKRKDFIPIGYITSSRHGLVVKDKQGNIKKIRVKGYAHF